jgi:hypothetical protein
MFILIQKDTTLNYLCTCRDVVPDNEAAEDQQMWEQDYELVSAYSWGYTIEPWQTFYTKPVFIFIDWNTIGSSYYVENGVWNHPCSRRRSVTASKATTRRRGKQNNLWSLMKATFVLLRISFKGTGCHVWGLTRGSGPYWYHCSHYRYCSNAGRTAR